MTKKKKRIIKERVFMVLFGFVFLLSFFFTKSAIAAANLFEITNVTLEEKSETVEGNIGYFDNNEIISTITYHEINDYAVFKITIKNNDDVEHKIKSITDNNNNPYIKYTYGDFSNIIIKSNETFDLIVKAEYKNELNDITKREQNLSIRFLINYYDENEEESSEIIINPSTGDKIDINFILFTISAAGLILCITKDLLKQKKKINKNVKALFVLALLMPVVVSASSLFNIKFENRINLYDKILVTYNVDNEEKTLIYNYGEEIELENPTKPGYIFKKWQNKDGSDFDLDTVVLEDFELVPVFEKIDANIEIGISDENEETTFKFVTITTSLINTTSNNVRIEYSLDDENWQEYSKKVIVESNLTFKARVVLKDSNYVIGENEKEITNIVYKTTTLLSSEDVYDIQCDISKYRYQIDDITLWKNSSIEHFYDIKDTLNENNIVSTLDSDLPTYMWIETVDDEIILYYYSDAQTIYLNEDSSYLYSYYANLREIDFDKIDTSKVVNMSYMFEEDKILPSLDLSGFNTSNVTNMEGMFNECTKITELDVSAFDTSNVTRYQTMFAGMSSLTTIYASSDWDFVGNLVFDNTTKIVGGAGTEYSQSKKGGEYARIDDPDNGQPGYFTGKNIKEIYIITFEGNGIEIERNIKKIVKGNKIGNLTVLERENYIFDGWYTGLTSGIKIEENYVPENDMTIYARWTEMPKYEIIYDYGDGRTENSFVYDGSSLGTLDTPTRDKYEFDGWYTDIVGGTKVNENYVPKSDMTIYARWIEIFTITLDGNGVELSDNEINILDGDSLCTLPVLEREYYYFDGWYTDIVGGIKVDENYIPESDMTIYARWIEKELYTITYDYGDGRTDISYVYEDETLRTLPIKSKEDSILMGWYEENTFENEVTSSTMPTKNATYYAKWSSMVSDDNDELTTLSSTTCPNNENITIGDGIVCKRALNLHEEICDSPQGCEGNSLHKKNDILTYGNCGTSGELNSGDAFTCDVNGDGKFNEMSERFYYVSDYYNSRTRSFESDTAVLIYYNNTSLGVATNRDSTIYATQEDVESLGYTCDLELGCSQYGPISAIKDLPTTLEWSNVSLKNDIRKITSVSVEGNNYNSIEDFSYNGYSARLLNANEVVSACNLSPVNFNRFNYIDSCNYFLENTRYSQYSLLYSTGYLLENPFSTFRYNSWTMSFVGSLTYIRIYHSGYTGVRPVIEVPKSKISY